MRRRVDHMMGHLGMVIRQGMRGMGENVTYQKQTSGGGGGILDLVPKDWIPQNPQMPQLPKPENIEPPKEKSKSKSVQYMMDQRDAETGKGYLSRVLTQQQSDREKLKSIGITAKDASIEYVGGPCSTQKAQARMPRGGVSMSAVQRVFEFDDCYIIMGSGGARTIPKYGGGAPGSGGGGVPVDAGPDWWAQYDAYLKSLHRDARTTTRAATWVGDPTAKPATGEDYLAIVQAQGKAVASSVMNPAVAFAQVPYYDPNAAPVTGGNILNAGSFAQREGPVLEFF
jgi:hypothetical protein